MTYANHPDPNLFMPPREIYDAAQLVVSWMKANHPGVMWEYQGLCDRRFAYRMHTTTALLKKLVSDNEARWDTTHT